MSRVRSGGRGSHEGVQTMKISKTDRLLADYGLLVAFVLIFGAPFFGAIAKIIIEGCKR